MLNINEVLDENHNRNHKPKSVNYTCTDPVEVVRLPNGKYSIYSAIHVDSHTNHDYLKYVKLSTEMYPTKSLAERDMMDGTYKLNPDYKSFFISQITDDMHFSNHFVYQKEDGNYVMAVAELVYDDDVEDVVAKRFITVSKESFSSEDEAKQKLENGEWTLDFKFSILINYNPLNKLRVMRREEDGRYFLGRNKIYENEDDGSSMTDLHELIIISAKDKEDAERELQYFLERV